MQQLSEQLKYIESQEPEEKENYIVCRDMNVYLKRKDNGINVHKFASETQTMLFREINTASSLYKRTTKPSL